jgi:predicted RNase H-like nuclease (RuvC/YqgF family)
MPERDRSPLPSPVEQFVLQAFLCYDENWNVKKDMTNKYSLKTLQHHMVKNDEEINSLGQLVVSMTKEILDTNRKVLDLEKRVSEQEKRSLEVEANRKIQELEKRITELEKKQLEPAEGKT